METGAQTLVLKDGFALGIVSVFDIDGIARVAGSLDGKGAVEVGIVIADVVVVAVVAVCSPVRGGAEANCAVERVACWSGNKHGCIDGF